MKQKTLFIIVVLLFSINVVSAKEVYYTNKNNVSFTKEEYEFISTIFYEGYQKVISIFDYNNIFKYVDILNSNINSKSVVFYDNPVLRTSYHETNAKQLKITSTCNNICFISVVVNWKNSPKIRSYDVIGSYLDGIELKDNPVTSVQSGSNINYSSEIVTQTNGFGTSIKLLSSGTEMIIAQYYNVSKGGTVYASYQHATSSISLANSKKYTISRSGYGGVFVFNSSVSSYYDAMGGVDITV